jgi:hypothetical protein
MVSDEIREELWNQNTCRLALDKVNVHRVS